MGRNCKSVGCSRKVKEDQPSLKLCQPCQHAFNCGQQQQAIISEEQLRAPPEINMDAMFEKYDVMEASPMKDIFGMLLNLSNNNAKIERLEYLVETSAKKIQRLEAIIGNDEGKPAVPLSLAIRNLPLPMKGMSELESVKKALFEIQAPNVDIEKDVKSAVRYGSIENNNLGVVMVEMSSTVSRASIMKSKKILETHNNPIMRKLIIKNMKSKSELKTERTLKELLKLLPGGGANFYIASNGQIKERLHDGF